MYTQFVNFVSPSCEHAHGRRDSPCEQVHRYFVSRPRMLTRHALMAVSADCTRPSSVTEFRGGVSPRSAQAMRVSSDRQPVRTGHRIPSMCRAVIAAQMQACASAIGIPMHEFRRVASTNPSRACEQIAPRRSSADAACRTGRRRCTEATCVCDHRRQTSTSRATII